MSKSSVTQEEKQFIAAQFVPPQCYDDCVKCGKGISSTRQLYAKGTDVCERCCTDADEFDDECRNQ